jgi:hypothetical protein
MIFKETPYPVRQKIGDAGSISTQNIFPLHSATPKPPESPYGASILPRQNPLNRHMEQFVVWFGRQRSFFQFFSLLAL